MMRKEPPRCWKSWELTRLRLSMHVQRRYAILKVETTPQQSVLATQGGVRRLRVSGELMGPRPLPPPPYLPPLPPLPLLLP